MDSCLRGNDRQAQVQSFQGSLSFGAERSEWDPEDLTEGRYDVEKNMRLIAESNARLVG